MRVCLINPPRIHPKSWGRPNVFQPTEIAYVAALLESQHNVHIVDAPAEGWRNLEQIDGTKYLLLVGLGKKVIEERIRRWSPDVVVVHIPFSGWVNPAFEVTSLVKSVDRKIALHT
jgi:hypothetical protein